MNIREGELNHYQLHDLTPSVFFTIFLSFIKIKKATAYRLVISRILPRFLYKLILGSLISNL